MAGACPWSVNMETPRYVEFLRLSNVVEDGTGDHYVAVPPDEGYGGHAHPCHAEGVIEQAAYVNVVHGGGGGVRKEPFRSCASSRKTRGAYASRDWSPHSRSARTPFPEKSCPVTGRIEMGNVATARSASSLRMSVMCQLRLSLMSWPSTGRRRCRLFRRGPPARRRAPIPFRRLEPWHP